MVGTLPVKRERSASMRSPERAQSPLALESRQPSGSASAMRDECGCCQQGFTIATALAGGLAVSSEEVWPVSTATRAGQQYHINSAQLAATASVSSGMSLRMRSSNQRGFPKADACDDLGGRDNQCPVQDSSCVELDGDMTLDNVFKPNNQRK